MENKDLSEEEQAAELAKRLAPLIKALNVTEGKILSYKERRELRRKNDESRS